MFSDPDADAPHVAEADAAVRLPGSSPADTYLNAPALVAAALAAGADAVHPGYGFLSEDAGFARAVQAAGLTWVGPPADAIEAMGSKITSKKLAAEAGVPVLPELAPDAITGYPVLVKASAGGGGRGMRVVRSAGELPAALESARREAQSAFGDGTRVLRAAAGRRPARRGAGPGRRPRHGLDADRTRLLGAAPVPEGDRGDPVPGGRGRRCARGCSRPRQAVTARGRLPRRRHRRVPASPATGSSSSWSSTPGCRSSTRSPSACTASTWSRCSSASPEGWPCRRTRRRRPGTRSRPGCTPKTRPTATARPAARCTRCTSRAWTRGSPRPPPGRAAGCGWTRASRRAARSARTTTRCWPS